MKTFVISLPDSQIRREFISNQLDSLGIEFEFFDAVRGSELIGDARWYDDAKAKILEDRSLRAGEVGCALSHAAVYAAIVRQSLSWALILEDDARVSPDLPRMLELLEKYFLEQGDLVFLERCDHYKKSSAIPLFDNYKLVEPVLVRYGSCCQTAGYIVTNKAAHAIKERNIPVKFPADNWADYIGLVRYRGIVPTMSLIRQNVRLGSTITDNATRHEFTSYSVKDLLWNHFKNFTKTGKMLKHVTKRLLGRE
jgi:glycosyl transferase family 25